MLTLEGLFNKLPQKEGIDSTAPYFFTPANLLSVLATHYKEADIEHDEELRRNVYALKSAIYAELIPPFKEQFESLSNNLIDKTITLEGAFKTHLKRVITNGIESINEEIKKLDNQLGELNRISSDEQDINLIKENLRDYSSFISSSTEFLLEEIKGVSIISLGLYEERSATIDAFQGETTKLKFISQSLKMNGVHLLM